MENDMYLAIIDGELEQVEKLIESGQGVNDLLPQTGLPPIFQAITWNSKDIIKYLITIGADVNFNGKHGMTPLLSAVERANPDVCRILLQHNANPNVIEDRDLSALDMISQYEPRKTYRELIPVFEEFQHLLNDVEQKKLKKMTKKRKS